MKNVVCNPTDEVSFEEHKHTCDKCHSAWKHTDDVVDTTDEEFDEAHTCPVCGATNQTLKIMDIGEITKQMKLKFGITPSRSLAAKFVELLADDTQ